MKGDAGLSTDGTAGGGGGAASTMRQHLRDVGLRLEVERLEGFCEFGRKRMGR